MAMAAINSRSKLSSFSGLGLSTAAMILTPSYDGRGNLPPACPPTCCVRPDRGGSFAAYLHHRAIINAHDALHCQHHADYQGQPDQSHQETHDVAPASSAAVARLC